jgi:hypothetical protein
MKTPKIKKGQSALEFMTIVALGLALIAISSIFGFDYIFSYFDGINAVNADEMTDNIVSAVNLVYSQGIGAQTKIVVNVPSKIMPNWTYLSSNEINIRLYSGAGYTDVYKRTAVNMTGSIPINDGQLTLYIKMMPNYAIISSNTPVSYASIKLFNNSGRTLGDYNFTTGETVYYSVYTYDFNSSAVDSDLVMKVFSSNSSQVGNTVEATTTGGVYNGSFVLGSGNNGALILSADIPDFGLISTSMFYKY